MSNEQKSAFRSRNAQEDSLTYHLGGLQAAKNFRLLARAFILEAEARGVAEERANAAKGQELAIWEYQDSVGQWVRSDSQEHAENWAQILGTNYRSLYTRPANVAVLEARVKELEAAITALFDGQAVLENGGWDKRPDRIVLYDDERMASGKDPVDVAIRGAEQIRASLTREGGV